MDPKELRREKRSLRRSLSTERHRELSQQICRRIETLEVYQRARTILVYKAVQGEVDLSWLDSRGKTLAYPLCLDGGQMIALAPGDERAWRPGPFGIPEPVPELSRQIEPNELDLILCPCVAFDAACRRLGQGGGYYDRYLPKADRAVTAAVAYELQRVDALQSRPWDMAMDMVVTESGIYTP